MARENCVKEEISKGNFIWECEPVVEKKVIKGLLNWNWDKINGIPITQYEGGLSAAYEDKDCCSSSLGGGLIEAIETMFAGIEETNPTIFPKWLPLEYRPFIVELQWGADLEDDYGVGDFPFEGKGHSMTDVFVMPPLPYEGQREKYPLMDEVIGRWRKAVAAPTSEVKNKWWERRRGRASPLEPHYDFMDRLWEMEGNVGATVVHIEVLLGKNDSVSEYPEAHGINTWTRPAMRVLFLDEKREYVEKHETVWIFPAMPFDDGSMPLFTDSHGSLSMFGDMVKMFAPSQEAFDVWLATYT